MIAFLFGECTSKEYFDLKITVVPESKMAVRFPNDMNTASEIIRKRLIDTYSIPEGRMKLDVNDNQISLTIFKADTSKIASIKKIITGYARLEFWETYENSQIIGYLSKADSLLRSIRISEQNPLFNILGPRLSTTGEPLPSCLVGLADEKDTTMVNSYLKMDKIKELFPNDLKFLWSSSPYKYGNSKSLYGLHAIKVTTADKLAPLDGKSVISAEVIGGSNNKDVRIGLTMYPEGEKTWARVTRENISRCIAVVCNGYVRSYPRVQAEISGGKTEITGDFTIEEANDLVGLLKSGELPFGLKIADIQIIKR